MPLYKDQCGNTVDIYRTPERIISLVPSQTELLHFLGLDNRVIGITKFCKYPPEWYNEKQKVGGTKNINQDLIRKLNPDLILANREENVKEEIDVLSAQFPVWVTDIKTLDDALSMIGAIGEITGSSLKATNLITEIRSAFTRLQLHPEFPQAPAPTAYLIWKKPYMAAGGDTFIHHMMQYCGFKNIFKEFPRYPVVTLNQIKDAGCKLLLLSSEPYPFSEKHLSEFLSTLPGVRIMLVDGEMFSWYGSRMVHAAKYFSQLISLQHAR